MTSTNKKTKKHKITTTANKIKEVAVGYTKIVY